MERWLVVGGGAAGCVVAGALSERTDREVVLLEAGADHGGGAVDGDVGPYLDDPARIASVEVARRPGGRREAYLQGSGLGGSTLVNGAVVTSPGEAPPSLELEAPWAHGAVAEALLAADEAARSVSLVRQDGARRTAADIFLRPHLGRPNLAVWCETEVASVRLHRRRAIGVELAGGGSVDADRVIVCAGALRSPALLLRSGVDTPGVGEGLSDHPAFTLTLRLRPTTIDRSVPTISVAATHPEHQVVALDHVPGAPDLGALMVSTLRPHSRGRVTLDADGRPLVDLRLLDEAADREALVDAVATTVSCLDDAAWGAVVDEVYVDDRGTRLGDVVHDHLDRWVVNHAGGHHHVAGTCRDGVVTDEGAVRGYESLFVADASALPGVPPVDTYVAVIRQADRLSRGWV